MLKNKDFNMIKSYLDFSLNNSFFLKFKTVLEYRTQFNILK